MTRLFRVFRGLVPLLFAVFALGACAPAVSPALPAQAPTAAASTATSVPANAGAELQVAQIQGFGRFLTDGAGRTLYEFDKDTKDTSTCSGTCAQNWPAFVVKGSVAAPSGLDKTLVGTAPRADGTTQVTFGGRPLYYYAGDKNPGDVKGQGIGSVWHVVSPRGTPMNNAVPPSTTPTP